MLENELRPAKERAATWFIAAVMVAALLWFAGQAGWFSPQEQETIPAAVSLDTGKNISMRRGLALPVLPIEELRNRVNAAACVQLHANGVNWILIRLPLWIPSPRRLEYDGFDFIRVQDIVRQARAAGLGVSLSPVYWDGSTMHDQPPVKITSSFLQQYRDMLLDIAAIARECGADALLLDGLFGNPAVSATDWLQLLEDIRGVFSGALEARLGRGHTPMMYIRQLDGGILSAPDRQNAPGAAVNDTLFAAYRNEAGSETKLFFAMRDVDTYAADGMPWIPVLSRPGNSLARAATMLYLPFILPDTSDGFFLSGSEVFEQLSDTEAEGSPLARRLRALRQMVISNALERRAREHTLR
ncbi:MAG: hypothetical protein KFH87_01350 [Bacteroidetes bacterium]|nr:hypothetical protein [Bacteroidota bacterium]